MTQHDSYQAAMLALGPLAYWTFQGLAPGALFDVTGHGHDLVGHGGYTLGSAVPGFDGFECCILDGATGYFTVSSDLALHVDPFSVVGLWAPAAGDAYMVSSELDENHPDFSAIVEDTAHGYKYGARAFSVVAEDTVPWGSHGAGFHMLSIAHDGSFLSTAVDGNPVGSAFLAPYTPGVTPWTLGRAAFGGHFAAMSLSDIAVFGSVVGAQQSTELANLAGIATVRVSANIEAKLDSILASVRKAYG